MTERMTWIRDALRRARPCLLGAGWVLLALVLPGTLAAQTADVSITKLGPSQLDGDGPRVITYLVVTTNNGPSTATNLVVRDTLPPTSQFRFVSASRGASRTARRLSWPATTLASGQSIVDTVIIEARAGVGSVVTNVAVASADEADPVPSNNQSQVQTLIVDANVIAVSVTPDGADTTSRLPSNGTGYAYVFTVSNTGDRRVDVELAGWLENAVCLFTGSGGGVVRRNRILRNADLLCLECRAVQPPRDEAEAARPDVIFEQWDNETYEGWSVTGDAFGAGPLRKSEFPDYQGDVGGTSQRVANSHATAPGENVGQKDGLHKGVSPRDDHRQQ